MNNFMQRVEHHEEEQKRLSDIRIANFLNAYFLFL